MPIAIVLSCSCGRKPETTIAWIEKHTHYECVCGKLLDLRSEEFLKLIGKPDLAQSVEDSPGTGTPETGAQKLKE